MFNTGSRMTFMESMIEAADSALESADSSADSAKVGVWVQALFFWGGGGFFSPGLVQVLNAGLPLRSWISGAPSLQVVFPTSVFVAATGGTHKAQPHDAMLYTRDGTSQTSCDTSNRMQCFTMLCNAFFPTCW